MRRPRSHETYCAFLTRYALTARTKQYGCDLALYGSKTQTVLILALFQRGQLTCLLSLPAMGNQGTSALRNVRTITYAVAD